MNNTELLSADKENFFHIIRASIVGADRILSSATMFGSEIRNIPNEVRAAILCANLKMESALTQGVFKKPHVDLICELP